MEYFEKFLRKFPEIFPSPGNIREDYDFVNIFHMFWYLIKLVVVNDPNHKNFISKILQENKKTFG